MRTADFLLRCDQKANGMPGQLIARLQSGDRFQGDDDASFHIQGAGTVEAAVFDFDRHVRQRAGRMHGVNVHQEEEGFAGRLLVPGREQEIAEFRPEENVRLRRPAGE